MTDTLDGLRRSIASLYNKNTTNNLGSVALEIILKRNEARDELEHSPSLDKKEEINCRIDELHEFERVIVSLYMLQSIKSSHGKLLDMPDFTKQKYYLFNRRIQP